MITNNEINEMFTYSSYFDIILYTYIPCSSRLPLLFSVAGSLRHLYLKKRLNVH